MSGRIYIMIGASSAGKDTLVEQAKKVMPNLEMIVKATTRKPRKNEVNGVHYHFVWDELFDLSKKKGEYIHIKKSDWDDSRYAIIGLELSRKVYSEKKDIVITGHSFGELMDVRGTLQTKGYKNILSIFVDVRPDIIKDRMLKKDSSPGYQARYEKELINYNNITKSSLSNFDYVINNNGTIKQGVRQFLEILKNERR